MKTLIPLAATLLLISCATSPSDQLPQSTYKHGVERPPTPIPEAKTEKLTKTMSPGQGRFTAETIPLTKGAPGEASVFFVDLRIVYDKMDLRWAPTIGACVSAKNRRPEACVLFSKYQDEDLLYASGSLMPEGGPPFVRTDLSSDHPANKVHRLKVSVTGTRVRFDLMDGSFYEETLTLQPENLRLSCSSAKCEVAAERMSTAQ